MLQGPVVLNGKIYVHHGNYVTPWVRDFILPLRNNIEGKFCTSVPILRAATVVVIVQRNGKILRGIVVEHGT